MAPRWWQWWSVLALRILPFNVGALLVGSALLVLGIAFAAWARAHLGTSWSGRGTIKEDHKLIQTGPYGRVRNPIYTGLLVALVGTALTEPRLRGALAVAVYCAAITLKIRTEERLRSEQFGEEYRTYRLRTKALIPFVV